MQSYREYHREAALGRFDGRRATLSPAVLSRYGETLARQFEAYEKATQRLAGCGIHQRLNFRQAAVHSCVDWPLRRVELTKMWRSWSINRFEKMEILHNQQVLKGVGKVEGMTWTLNEAEGNIMFAFDGVPSDKLRAIIESYSFKWSRYTFAWGQKTTPNGIALAERLKSKLLNF